MVFYAEALVSVSKVGYADRCDVILLHAYSVFAIATILNSGEFELESRFPDYNSLPILGTMCLMALTDEQVKQFRQLYFKRFGKEISKEEAYEQGIKLIAMLKLIYKPMPLEEYEALQNRRLEMLPQIVEHIALHDNDEVV